MPVPSEPFQPGLMFVGKASAYLLKHLPGSLLKDRLLALPTNIR